MDAAELTAHLKEMTKPKERDLFIAKCAARAGLDVKNVAEIGVFQGAFSLMLRQRFPAAHLWLIDPWRHLPELKGLVGSMHRRGKTPERNQVFWDRMYRDIQAMFQNDPNVTILRKLSAEAAADVPDDSLDIVHIDGDHRYEAVCQDIKLWLPKVKHGGLVTGHDYKFARSQWGGNRGIFYKVYTAVNDTLGVDNIIGGRQMTWIYVKP